MGNELPMELDGCAIMHFYNGFIIKVQYIRERDGFFKENKRNFCDAWLWLEPHPSWGWQAGIGTMLTTNSLGSEDSMGAIAYIEFLKTHDTYSTIERGYAYMWTGQAQHFLRPATSHRHHPSIDRSTPIDLPLSTYLGIVSVSILLRKWVKPIMYQSKYGLVLYFPPYDNDWCKERLELKWFETPFLMTDSIWFWLKCPKPIKRNPNDQLERVGYLRLALYLAFFSSFFFLFWSTPSPSLLNIRTILTLNL